jgi:LmbE family N-acetylglucosaminyl deacetylase
MTDGRNSHLLNFGIKSKPSPAELKLQRIKEETEAMNILGVPKENIFFLGIEDGLLYKNRRKVTLRISQLLQELTPSEIFVPFHNDKHPDHIATYLIVLDCLKNLNLRTKVIEYFVWTDPANFELKNAKKDISDISKELNIKNLAISKYKSQITKFSEKQPRPVLDEKFLKRFRESEREIFLVEFKLFRNPLRLVFLHFKALILSCLIKILIALRKRK